MNKEIKNKFPSWIDNNKKYSMCLTDDLDSLFSCLLLQKIKKYEITHFYSFNTLYKLIEADGQNQLCGVDMDLIQGRCWGNHVVGHNNPQSANLNTILNINSNNYYTKYAGSVLLQIISYYNLDISMLSEEAKMVLLAIDSTFLMYNFNKSNAKRYIVDILELEELWEILERHKNIDFEKLNAKYNLKSKITMSKDGYLQTNIKLSELDSLFKSVSFILPKNQFNIRRKYKDVAVNRFEYDSLIEKLAREDIKVFSQAQTNKTFFKLSYEI